MLYRNEMVLPRPNPQQSNSVDQTSHQYGDSYMHRGKTNTNTWRRVICIFGDKYDLFSDY